jgi:hypothetical protein
VSSVVWVSEPLQQVLCERLDSPRLDGTAKGKVVSSVKEFIDATRDPKTIAFVDSSTFDTVANITHVPLPGPVIAICDGTLQDSIAWLQPNPWVCHVMSRTTLEQPIGDELLGNVVSTVVADRPRLLDWIGSNFAGRRIRLTHASRRTTRLERMCEFFETNKVGGRTIEALRDAAEELLTNAFYDAPVAAGALKQAVPRTQDIALPDDSACDLAYGVREDLAVVRVRDPFGSLTRRRLVEVLSRCARTDMGVEVDETMGGAGLGMWRIFSGSTFVAISVIKGQHTEILVGIAKKAAGGPKPYAFSFFFRESAKRRFWRPASEHTNTPSSVNKSVMIVNKSK